MTSYHLLSSSYYLRIALRFWNVTPVLCSRRLKLIHQNVSHTHVYSTNILKCHCQVNSYVYEYSTGVECIAMMTVAIYW